MESAAACWWLLTWVLGAGCPTGEVIPQASVNLWYQQLDSKQQVRGWSEVGWSVVNWQGSPHVLQLEQHYTPALKTNSYVKTYYNLQGKLLYVLAEDLEKKIKVEQFHDAAKAKKLKVHLVLEDGSTKNIELKWQPGSIPVEELFNYYRNLVARKKEIPPKLKVFIAPALLSLQGTPFSNDLSVFNINSKFIREERLNTIDGPKNHLYYKLEPAELFIRTLTGEKGFIHIWVSAEAPYLIYQIKQDGILRVLKRIEHNSKTRGITVRAIK